MTDEKPGSDTETAAVLESLLQQWEASHENGSPVTVEELCADHLELLPLLQKQIQSLQAMDWLDRAPGTTTGRLTIHRSEERRFEESNLSRSVGFSRHVQDLVSAKANTTETVGHSERPVPLLLSGRYQLQNLIAEGGYGQVWRAIDSALERPVAIKLTTLPCVQEARRVASLKHQGIVSVHDVGNQDGFCFIVFDLVEGTDLAERIRLQRLPWREAVEIVALVTDYVGFAHRRGYVHRDIKPANILLDQGGTPILADFGIAVTRTELEQQVTTTLGTVAYMAPEQLTADVSADSRIDIYGLGIVLYEALTGQVPFRARTL